MNDANVAVVVVGAAGRMGRFLVTAVTEADGQKLTGATESPGHPQLGQDAGLLAGVGELGVTIGADLKQLVGPETVVIDFTAPEPTIEHAKICAAAGAAIVIGTTGMSPAQKDVVTGLGDNFSCVMAPNMSVGVNLLFYLVEQASRITGESFDLEIVEAHHRLKKDAPSGTALRLAEAAATGRGWDLEETARYCREGIIGERPEREIGIQTVRAGDIVGDHAVIMAGDGERLELTHRAHSRVVFAQGAARAVTWIAKNGPGTYDMWDVLGLKSQ